MSLANYKIFSKEEEPMFCGRTNFKKALQPKFFLDSRLNSPEFHLNTDLNTLTSNSAFSSKPSVISSSSLPATATATEDPAKICKLIKIDAEYPSIHGRIRVSNIEFRKHVFVRYTKNKWLTYDELTAYYVRSELDGKYDIFCFDIDLLKSFLVGQEVEFAVCFHAMSSAKFFWDNNKGMNYRIECVLHIKDSMKR
jgi:hypothetical protein